jgi:hypothetical protein
VLKLALAFAAASYPVFPVDVFWDDERKRWRKVPCIKEWERRATTNPILIEWWWAKWPLAVPGVPLGRCGKVVVDADRHPGGSDGVALFHELDRTRGPFPVHPFNYTKSGGEHHWFSQPATPVRYGKWAGGEVLGHGRFVVGYAVPEGECPELPGVFRQGLIAENRANKNNPIRPFTFTRTPSPTSSPVLRSKYLILDLERAIKTNRHNMLYWTSCRLGNMIGEGKIKTEIAEHLLIEGAKANGIWREEPDNCLTTIRDGLRRGKEEWVAWAQSKRADVCVSSAPFDEGAA